MHLNKISTALVERVHGGPDACGSAQFDFSTNSNACGPCPSAVAAVSQADATRYPDASYTQLRAHLAQFHGVDAARVLLAGSASEFIFRITAWVARGAGAHFAPAVHVPTLAYGDYLHAAHAWGLALAAQPDDAQLVWACEPSSPLGQGHSGWPVWLSDLSKKASAEPPDLAAPAANSPLCVLDRAYAPLRLSGMPSLAAVQLDQVWQLFTPNKALGLTGVRAAYVIAPRGADAVCAAIDTLAPSWPVGAHGVAMLQAWVSPEVQAWLADCLPVLRDWKARQIAMLQALDWQIQPSEANFICAKPPSSLDLAALRGGYGIKLRDASSFGLPFWLRLGVLPPESQAALHRALTHLGLQAGFNLNTCVAK